MTPPKQAPYLSAIIDCIPGLRSVVERLGGGRNLLSPRAWRNTYKVLTGKHLALFWCRGDIDDRNWGDKINPLLVGMLSGKPVVHSRELIHLPSVTVYACVGSILQSIPETYAHFCIWGPGFISQDSMMPPGRRSIQVVRGPKTLSRLKAQGMDVRHAIFGDPVLLLPSVYQPKTPKKKYLLGIVPHYVDLDNPLIERLQLGGAKVISVFSDELDFVDQVCECECIASSSLHGLVCADAYGVPNKWFVLSSKVIGDGFKFLDYYASIGLSSESPTYVDKNTEIEALVQACSLKDVTSLQGKLSETCPFNQSF